MIFNQYFADNIAGRSDKSTVARKSPGLNDRSGAGVKMRGRFRSFILEGSFIPEIEFFHAFFGMISLSGCENFAVELHLCQCSSGKARFCAACFV